MPTFFAGEDVVINTDMLQYAAVETDSEGLHVRLGFACPAGELRLSGLEARAMLRWLLLNFGPMEAGRAPRGLGPGPLRRSAADGRPRPRAGG